MPMDIGFVHFEKNVRKYKYKVTSASNIKYVYYFFLMSQSPQKRANKNFRCFDVVDVQSYAVDQIKKPWNPKFLL